MKTLLLTILLTNIIAFCQGQNFDTQKVLSQSSGLIENKGQLFDSIGNPISNVFFYSESGQTRFYITSTGITFLFTKSEAPEADDTIDRKHESGKVRWEKIDLEIENGIIDPTQCVKQYPVAGQLNFYTPSSPNGIQNVQEFQRIIFKNVYPNIDWEIYMCPSQGIKYDFVLHGGAKIDDIQLVYHSLQMLSKGIEGDLRISTSLGDLNEHAPVSYFDDEKILSEYIVDSVVRNNFGGFDSHYHVGIDAEWSTKILNGSNNDHLVIDPEITWATFYGGGLADGTMSIAIADNDDTYIGGYKRSLDFPTFQDSAAYYQGISEDSWGAVILKFTENGERLWTTLYEGTGDEELDGIELDSEGNLYCVGYTNSVDFPLQNSGTFFQNSIAGSGISGFILKFDSNGQRVWATFIEGTNIYCHNVVVDHLNNIFVVGRMGLAGNFPYMDNGNYYQTQALNSQLEGFILKFDANGNQLWGTTIGGTNIPSGSIGDDIAFGADVNSVGELYVTGVTMSKDFPLLDNGHYFDNSLNGYIDAFIMKFSNSGTLLWSTLVGDMEGDYGKSVVIDHDDNLLLTGYTRSTNLGMLNPHNGYGDFFVIKFSGAGQKLWGRYFGGIMEEIKWTQTQVRYYPYNEQLAVDLCGNYYFFFETNSNDVGAFSNWDGYFDDDLGGSSDQFLSIMNSSGSLLYGSYLGGDGDDFRASLAINSSGNLMLTGEWGDLLNESSYPIVQNDPSSYFDTTFNGFPDDMFFAKMKMSNDAGEHFCEAYNEIDSGDTPFLSFPNVFSPNEDDINDFFQSITVKGVLTFEIDVLNRWGVPVFNSLETEFQWDGTDQDGIPLVEGTYFWTAKYTDLSGETFKQHGFVVLVR